MTIEAEERAAIEDLGVALVAEGCWDDARVVWEGLAALDPRAEAPFRLLAVIAARQGRWEDAEALATASLGRAPGAAALLLRAEARWRSGRYAEAAADLEDVARAPGAGGPAADDELLRRRASALLERLRRPGR